ncbi:MAG: ABC transporter ATP-binding protein [Candidatus Omnitrophica bacterium]|nr:ABC transporter ATP-binding protein [Candidatus Omnitrophota bacterium]
MIEIRGVYRSFGDNHVLNGVDLTVKRGETKVIIGRSGCGKSVLLKHIVGILNPDKGEVLVGGKNIVGLSEKDVNSVRMKIGMVFQGGALFDSMSVGDNVGFSLKEHTDLSGKEILERVEESLCMVDLCGIEHLMPAELSGGMKKRVAVARAICNKPEIILYDEPTTGVDPITADSINDLIRNMHDKLKITTIVVTHDMKSAYKVADTIAMLYKGRIIAQGRPEEIQHTAHPVVHQFINGLAKGPITETLE